MELKANDGWYYLGWQGYTRLLAIKRVVCGVLGSALRPFGSKTKFFEVDRL